MSLRMIVIVGLIALVSGMLCAARVARGEEAGAPSQDGSAIYSDAASVEVVRALARQRGGQPAALAQVIQLAREFEDAMAAEIIDELAAAHFRAGDLNLAAESRTFLVERFPAEPLARRSALWLVRLYASGEVAHTRRGESPGAANMRRQLSPAMASALKAAPETIGGGAATGAGRTQAGDPLATYALHLATNFMSRDAALAGDPALAFQRAVAARRAGQVQSSQALLSPLNHRGADDPWGQCARAEAWLEESRQEAAPKPVVRCIAAEGAPHLDGVLDEACWRGDVRVEAGAKPQTGGGVDVEAAADVRWAYDREHLYVAVQCRKVAGVDYVSDGRPRPRDGDLAAHDRVRLLVDVDRDYASWFELVVDSRGWTADGCWGDAAWNPTWYVARGETADGAIPGGGAWTIEAAIPLAELLAPPPSTGAAWAFTAERLPPMSGPTTSSGSRTHEPGPADFSVLLFE